MPIYEILSSLSDSRQQESTCLFNGYLEDYLAMYEERLNEEQKVIFQHLLTISPKMKICSELRLNINKDAIANQIISYRDSFKLPQGQIRCPDVIYDQIREQERAMILSFGEQEAYVMAKALYFIMSEPENEYEGTRNEIISMCANEKQEEFLQEAIRRFFFQKEKAGIVQRWLDMHIFTSYDEMYECAKAIASRQMIDLKEILQSASDVQDTINRIIAVWFLMKKFSYVQYMMDKNALYKQHDGNVKKQRQKAKEKCDSISFVSYSELWKLVKEHHI